MIQRARMQALSCGLDAEIGLSALDVEFMRQQYPKGGAGTVELDVGGSRVAADLAASGEVDTYHFAVLKAATYIMSTEGPSDTVLTLHGPSVTT